MAFGRTSSGVPSRERLEAIADSARATFGFPAAVAMALGLVAGLGLPELDDALDVQVPLFVFSGQNAARGMLETIATTTVAVAGIAISVTIVAFTLSANQLSPRVLRSFRRDLISQLTLAALLGTFIYCLAVLVRLGSLGPDRVPNLSIAVAVVLAVGSFAMFATFAGHIANMLQPSSIIASIAGDAGPGLARPYPAGIGQDPADPTAARTHAERMIGAREGLPIRSDGGGFLTVVRGETIIKLATAQDAIVQQRTPIGSYVLSGDRVAVAWLPAGAGGSELAVELGSCFEIGRQRTVPQDPGFSVRQLADVALKGLSPGINDPTTACTAMAAMTDGLIRFARSDPPGAVRLDESETPRFLAEAADLDDLARLGFEQVTHYAQSDPSVLASLGKLLGNLRNVASECGTAHVEIDRLIARIA